MSFCHRGSIPWRSVGHDVLCAWLLRLLHCRLWLVSVRAAALGLHGYCSSSQSLLQVATWILTPSAAWTSAQVVQTHNDDADHAMINGLNRLSMADA